MIELLQLTIRRFRTAMLCGVTVLFAGALFAQNTSHVFTLQASKGKADKSSSWKISGSATGVEIPSPGDVVKVLPGDYSLILDKTLEIGSLLLEPGAHLSLESRNNAHLKITQICYLGGSLSGQDLKGTLDFSGAQVYTDQHLPATTGASEILPAHPSHSGDQSRSGGCPYFTIVNNSTSPTCNGQNNGVASVETPTDGVGPYTFQWVGGPLTQTWSNRPAGTYTIIVIDVGQGGLPCSQDIFINEPAPVALFQLNETAPTCPSLCNGQASPVVIGGNGGYSYLWSSGETSLQATQLCDTFSLHIEDVNGCSLDTSVIFANAPAPFLFSPDVTSQICAGDSSGSVNINPTGGTSPYSFSWSGPNGFTSSTEDISNLHPGSYQVTLTDGNSCSADTTVDIIAAQPLDASGSVTDNICPSGNSGAIDLTLSGGTPPLDVAWNGPGGFNSNSVDISGLLSGNYTALISDSNSCSATFNFSIQEPDSVAIDTTITPVSCYGGTNGAIGITPSGGTSPYNYQWTGPGGYSSSAEDISSLAAGSYALVITDGNSCVSSAFPVTVPQPTSFQTDVQVTQITCHGSNDGAIQLTASGGSPPYSYAWTGPAGFADTTANISDLIAGTYTLILSDSHGCDTTLSADVIEPAQLQATATITDPLCYGDATGAISLQISGGTPGYLSNWTGPNGFTATADSIGNLAAGNYDVTVSDTNNCSISQTYQVNSPDSISIGFTTQDNLCFGASTGSATVLPTGGTPGYTYSWTGPNGYTSTSSSNGGLPSGSYIVQVTDQNGCSQTDSTTIGEPTPITIDAITTPPLCNSGSDGSITISVSGGMPGYTFSWSGPNGFSSSSQDITNLPAGSYAVTVNDQNGCDTTATIQLTEPDSLDAQIASSPPLCASVANGSIQLNLSGGTSPYTINWTGPNGFVSSDTLLTGLASGSYQLIATDAHGCSTSSSVTLANATVLSINGIVDSASCAGLNDGAISLQISGGTPGYLSNWTGPNGFSATADSIGNLAAGNYDVTVSDTNNCSISQTYQVNSPDSISIGFTTQDNLCFGASTGSATVLPTGGTPGYTYSWTGPNGYTSTSSSNGGLPSGSYIVQVTDQNGCSQTDSTTIGEPTPITIDAITTPPLCNSGSDGSITISVSGGMPGYTFSWSGPNGFSSSSQDITNLPAGSYAVTVNDQNGCDTTATIQLTEPDSLDAQIASSPPLCASVANGSIQLNLSGGTSPYTINWTGPNGFVSSDTLLTGLASGSYQLTATDAHGCSTSSSVTLANATALSINGTVDSASCGGLNNGAISISLSGGHPPYSVNWTGPSGFTSTDSILPNLAPGIYSVAVVDSNGCQQNQDFEVHTPGNITISGTVTDLLCAGSAAGSISISATGGVPGYSFVWSGPNGFSDSTQNISGLSGGDYTISVTDTHGCTEASVFTVQEPDSIHISTDIQQPTCQNSDGTITAHITGGTPGGGYTLNWTDSTGTTISTDSALANLAPGIYVLSVLDSNSCSITDTVTLVSNTFNTLASIMPANCFGDSSGAISLQITGGEPPYSFNWQGPNGFTSTQQNISNLIAGNYQLTALDSVGCQLDTSFVISEPDPIFFHASVTPITCHSDNDASISLNVTGGTAPYAVFWSGPGGFVADSIYQSNLSQGTYNLTLNDSLGCAADTNIAITNPATLTVSMSSQAAICNGSATGKAFAIPAGGTPPYQYSWTGPNGFTSAAQNPTGLVAGTYELTLSDSHGCQTIDAVTVSEPDPIAATFDLTNSACGLQIGAITAHIAGGSGFYTLTWTNAAGDTVGSDTSLANIPSGVYQLHVKDDNGCTNDFSTAISDQNATIDATATPVNCYGGNDGTLTAIVTGGTAPFTYQWIGPGGYSATDSAIANLMAGNYGLDVTDSNGCIYADTFNIVQPDSILISGVVQAVSCAGADGAITLTVSGGTSPYLYSWTGPGGFVSDQPSIDSLITGPYSVSVQDNHACLNFANFNVDQAIPLSVSIIQQNPSCASTASGLIQVNASGGNGNYTFQWMGPAGFTADSSDLQNLAAGSYSLHLTDDAGCALDTTIVLASPTPITLAITRQQPNCLLTNGSITVNPTGGSGGSGYLFSWTDTTNAVVGDSATLNNIGAGIYHLSVSDNNGCQKDTTIVLSDQGTDFTASITKPNCYGDSTGAISLVINSGTSPFTFSWNGPNGYSSNSQNPTNVLAGTYLVNIIDSAGCSSFGVFDVNQPDSIQNSIASTAVSCGGSIPGTALSTPQGGTPGYSYSWTGPGSFTSSDSAISVVQSGTYYLSLQDQHGCNLEDSVSIGQINSLQVFFNTTPPLCYGSSEGAIVTSHSGGIDPLAYSWNGPAGFSSSDSSISNLIAGNYALHLEDSVGCAIDTTVVLSQPDSLSVLLVPQTVPCFGDSVGGAISLTASGGTNPYQYSWSGPGGFSSTNQNISGLGIGSYTVQVQDTNGCSAMASDSIAIPDPLSVQINTTSPACYGNSDGTAVITPAGGTPTYIYQWSGPGGFSSADSAISDVVAGDYLVTVTDQHGCTLDTTATLSQPDSLVITPVSVVDANCNNDPSGSANIQSSGGTSPYSYSWTGPNGFTGDSVYVDSLYSGDYNVLVQDQHGCSDSLSIHIDYLIQITANAGNDTAVCRNLLPVQLMGSGMNVINYLWTNLQGDTLANSAQLMASDTSQTSTYILHTSNGVCFANDTVQLQLYDLPVVDAGENQDVFHDQVFQIGGSPTSVTGQIYSWIPGQYLNDSTAANPTGTVDKSVEFTVFVTDNNGCVASDSVLIHYIPNITIPSGITPNGDGINDTWVIDNIEQFPNCTVKVFNRWGDVLYEHTGYSSGVAWDGKYKGKAVPVGTYYYAIELNDPRFPDPITGPLSIYR